MNLILALIVLTIVILVHEFGHFIICKLSGVLVEEFAIGFGPKLFSIKGKETEYSVRTFLIGGYVKPLGEDQDVDHPRALNNAKVHKRILMVFDGTCYELCSCHNNHDRDWLFYWFWNKHNW